MSDARFVELYEQYCHHIHAYCRRRTAPDRVDDAVADTFLTAWRKIDAVPDGDEALPWLYAVAYRMVGHQWRSASRRSRLGSKVSALAVTPERQPEDVLVLSQENRQIIDALDRLKPAEQEILRLSIWEELSHDDIGSVFDLGVDAVRKRLSRARHALAREYNRLEGRPTQPPAAQKGGTW